MQPVERENDTNSWRLDGKTVLVTGAGSGIGAAVARLAVGDGARVIAVDLDSDAARSAAADIGATFEPCDVSDAAAWAALAARLDSLDVAVLNAGVIFRTPAEFTSSVDDPGLWELDRYERARGVNIDGVVFGVRALVPVLERKGGGAITATASLAGLIPWSTDPIYSMTKWAVVGLCRALGAPLKRKGITINAVCPGPVATPMTEVRDGSVPMGMSSPEDIARVHLMLATSKLTGKAVPATLDLPPEPHSFNLVGA